MKLSPEITTDFYFNGGRPFANGHIIVMYYYTNTIYKDTPSGEIVFSSEMTILKTTALNDGLFYDSGSSKDPAGEAEKKGSDYIREHADHFIEEAYEKIPEARNADEIIY